MNNRPDWISDLRDVPECEKKLKDSPELKDQILSECYINLEVRYKVEVQWSRPGQCLIPTVREGASVAAWLAAQDLIYKEKVINEIIPLMPPPVAELAFEKIKPLLTPTEQNAYINYLLKNKRIEHLNLVKKMDYLFSPSQEKELARLNAVLFKPKIAESNPINDEHARIYGSQEEYKEFYDITVKLIADEIKDGLKTPEQAEVLMSVIADRRRHFAHQSDTLGKINFGLLRLPEKSSILTFDGNQKIIFGGADTPLAIPNYMKYYDRVESNLPLEIKLGDITLTYIAGNGTITHYVPDNSLIKILQKEYMDLSNAQFTNPQEAAKAIGHFHWLASHLMRWHRGNAAIMEQMTDAIWVKNFGSTPVKPLGLSLDCEALIQPSRETYAAQYAGFFSALPTVTVDFNVIRTESILTPKGSSASIFSRLDIVPSITPDVTPADPAHSPDVAATAINHSHVKSPRIDSHLDATSRDNYPETKEASKSDAKSLPGSSLHRRI